MHVSPYVAVGDLRFGSTKHDVVSLHGTPSVVRHLGDVEELDYGSYVVRVDAHAGSWNVPDNGILSM